MNTKQYTSTEIKELHEFSVGGNIYENICWLSLFNEDDYGVETDTVVIELTQKDIRSLIKSLETFLRPEEYNNG